MDSSCIVHSVSIIFSIYKSIYTKYLHSEVVISNITFYFVYFFFSTFFHNFNNSILFSMVTFENDDITENVENDDDNIIEMDLAIIELTRCRCESLKGNCLY